MVIRMTPVKTSSSKDYNLQKMITQRIKKGSMAFILLVAFLPSPMHATPLSLIITEDDQPGESPLITESWRKYDFNGDGKFDQADINELVDQGVQAIEFDLNHDGNKDLDDALALFLILSVMDRSCNGEVDDSDFEPVNPISLPDAPDIKTVRRIVGEKVALARINLPSDIEDQAFMSVPPGEILTLAERAYVYQVAGLSGLAQKNLDAAIWGFGRSFQTDESRSEAIGSLAFCLAVNDQDNEALQLLSYTIKMIPESSAAATSLGWAFARHGQNEQALEYLRDAVLFTPGIAQYHMNLGVLLMRMGMEREAYEEFRKGMELDPSDAGKFLLWYTTKPPDEPPVRKPFDPEEFKKARDIEIVEMEELGLSEEELPKPWDQMSHCDQARLIPEIIEQRNAARMNEIAQDYANRAASKIDNLIKGYWPKWNSIAEDWNRYVDGVPVVYGMSQVIIKNAEKMAGNESASRTREAGTELLGYSSFFMESALQQATSDANEAIKRLSRASLPAQTIAQLKSKAYNDALANAVRYCYKAQMDIAYRWITMDSNPYGLPSPDIEAAGVQDFLALYLIIPQMCATIKGYCPDKPDLQEPPPVDLTVGLDLWIVSIEWNAETSEFEMSLGQGLIVGVTWNPETGFGAEFGLGIRGSTGFAGGEMAVYATIDEGKVTLEGRLEGSVGFGPGSIGGELTRPFVVGQLYKP